MNCIDKLVHQNESFSIHNIKKLKINHLPYSLKVLLENILRNNSNVPSHQNIIDQFIGWNGDIKSQIELSFSPSRVIMQDFTGVPAIVDLACLLYTSPSPRD